MKTVDGFRHQHFTDLDGLRGILAMFVVLGHFGLNSAVQRLSYGRFPPFQFVLSVDFFFVLSGFVLSYSFSVARPTLGVFAWKRCVRLLPVHLFAAGWAVLLVPVTTAQVARNLLLLSPFAGEQFANFAAWSVAFEFYLPIMGLWAWRSAGHAPIGVHYTLAVLSAAGVAANAALLTSGTDHWTFRALAGIPLGVALFELARRHSWFGRPPAPARLYLSIGSMIVLTALVSLSPWFGLLMPVVFSAAVLLGANSVSMLSRGVFKWLGFISYTVYLVHIPMLFTMMALWPDRMGRNIVMKLAGVIASLVAATIVSLLIERPAMRWGAGLLRRRREAPA